jgi:protein involved in polysaccharide export with SLBB domain
MLKLLARFLRSLAVVVATASFTLGAPEPAERVIVVGDRTHGPTEIPYSAGLTVSKAVIAAGGYADFSRTPISLIRCGQVTRVDLQAVVSGESDKDFQLKPWDIIVVGLGITSRR